MTTMISETHSGEHVRTYFTQDSAQKMVEWYVRRGFDLVRNVTAKTVLLRSGRASVIITRDATAAETANPTD